MDQLHIITIKKIRYPCKAFKRKGDEAWKPRLFPQKFFKIIREFLLVNTFLVLIIFAYMWSKASWEKNILILH